MAGHAKKCVERYCELANKTTQQLYKVSTPCIDDHHFKEEETKSVGELSQVCSQIVLKCLYLARIGRLDILWSVNKLARSRSKKEVIDEARTSDAKVHFVSLMDICHLKNGELEAKHQKYKGRVVLRGDTVKDDSGAYAVFTEQGSSASQMKDIISRPPGCSGQAADAVSAFTQVKKGRRINVVKKSKQMANIMVQYGRPSRSSRKESVRSCSGRTIVGKTI